MKPGCVTEAEHFVHLSIKFHLVVLFPDFLLANKSVLQLVFDRRRLRNTVGLYLGYMKLEHSITRFKPIKLHV